MEPPHCGVCGSEEFEGAEVVYFLETPDVLEEQRRMEEKDFSYHPMNAVWFCPKHLKLAQEFTHLPKEEALAELKKKRWFNFLRR